jgi:hypothetical protein
VGCLDDAGRRDRALFMTENPAHQAPTEPIAIVGMACRFPDAAGPAEFLELVLTGRRAFRRLPPARLDVSEYGDGEPGFPGPSGLAPGAFGSARAALLEGWRFDRAAYGVTLAAYQAADPAHWLALETAARALADGGFPGGQGLTRDRTGVIIGNTLTGEVSRATALRTRWPYVRRVLRAALAAGKVSPERHAEVIEHAASGFLAPFPEISDDTLAGSLPGRSPTGSAGISASGAAAMPWTRHTPRPCSPLRRPAPPWPPATLTRPSPGGWISASTRSNSPDWPGPASWPAARCGFSTLARPGSCQVKDAGSPC